MVKFNILKKRSLNFFVLIFALIFFTACQDIGEGSSYKEDLNRAYQLASTNDWESCISILQALLTKNTGMEKEEESLAWLLMARALASSGQVQEATKLLEFLLQEKMFDSKFKIIAYERLIQIYRLTKNRSKLAEMKILLITEKQKTQFIGDNEIAKVLMQVGIDYQGIQNYQRAQEIFDIAIAKADDLKIQAEILYYKAFNEFHQKNFEQAKLQIKTMLEKKDSTDEIEGQARYLLGEVFEKESDFAMAYVQYKNALGLHPNKMLIQNRLQYLEQAHPELVEEQIFE